MLNYWKDEIATIPEKKAILENLKKELHTCSTKDHERLENIANNIQITEIEIALIKENATMLFFKEYMPMVIYILKKYNGKSYGPKTREKIRDEIKKELNIGFYVNTTSYHCTACIYPLNKDHYTDYSIKACECTQYSHNSQNYILTTDNKINVKDNVAYTLSGYSGKEIVTDTRKAAENILMQLNKVKETEKLLHDQVSLLNKMLPTETNNIVTPYMRYPF